MKKYSFIIIMLGIMCTTPLRAQYHIIGDTVPLHDSIWWRPQWFNNWVDSIPPNSLSAITQTAGGSFEELYDYTTDRPIRVIGIAACAVGRGESAAYDITDSMTGAQEYFYIYKSRSQGDEVPLRAVPWNPTAPHRYIQSRLIKPDPHNCDSLVYVYYDIKPLYEIYFEDNPLVLTDTFYIGYSGFSDTLVEDGFDVLRLRLCGRMNHGRPCGGPFWPYVTCILTSYRGSWTLPAGKPVPTTEILYPYIFPILSQDTDFTYLDSCPAVSNIRLDTIGGVSILRWDSDSLNVQWQLSISDTSHTHSTHLLDTLVDTPFLDLSAVGIEPPVTVQVRPRCLCYEYFDVWGNWGDCTELLPLPVPDTCRPVENLQFVRTGRRTGTLTWIPDTLQSLWQVSVGLVDGDVSEAFFDTLVSVPFLDIDSTMAPTVFTAHVRAICGEDNMSDWVSVTAEPYESIAQAVAPDVQLVPNPADGLVRVVAPDGLRGIEVYDMSGRRMLVLTASSTESSFNVTGWPVGTYIVILRTTVGSSVQRLAVK